VVQVLIVMDLMAKRRMMRFMVVEIVMIMDIDFTIHV
jgi:hypothetical protein